VNEYKLTVYFSTNEPIVFGQISNEDFARALSVVLPKKEKGVTIMNLTSATLENVNTQRKTFL
jgi:hypothetical protein